MNERSGSTRTAGTGLALFTDLYELTMLRAYVELGMRERAVFSLFVRKLPAHRNYLVACGLADLLDQLEELRFAPADVDYVASLGLFPATFLDFLTGYRFTGDVFAVQEGTPVFANEPILEVVAPIGEAQLIETLVLNQIGVQTIIASKAARLAGAARGRPVIDFGGRRAQGLDAAVKGARACYIAGISSTSNVLAGREYAIPVAGTMAHSFVEACATELDAFDAFARVFPDTILLVDTYDTLEGVRRVVTLAQRLGPAFKVRGIRLDSGDLLQLSQEARRILDAAGLAHLRIVASGGLDEHEVERLVAARAPIDVFGVGTAMSVSTDAPALDIAYKLTQYAGTGRMKLSTGKRTLPGRKQVFREFRDGVAVRDTIARDDEIGPGVPLLHPVMTDGRRVSALPGLTEARRHAAEAIASLPERLRSLQPADPPYEVSVSARLQAYERDVRDGIVRAQQASSG